MNRGELVTQIGYRIRTASRNSITATEIQTELNRSLRRLNGRLDLASTIATGTITFTGDGTYALPTTFKSPIQMMDRDNNIIYRRVSKAELRELEDGGVNNYAVDVLNADIESTTSSGTISLIYYSTNDAETSGGTNQQGLSADTDLPLLQDRFHDYFVEDVSAILFRKQKKYDDFRVAKAEATSIYADIAEANVTKEEVTQETVRPYNETYQ